MKALTDRLLWVQLYVNGELGQDETSKRLAQDELMCAMAIAEALPEIEARLPESIVDRQAAADRAPPERIVHLPER